MMYCKWKGEECQEIASTPNDGRFHIMFPSFAIPA